jgi:murein DD-endopeptidase MepM/ murein hydrolase activator NlpD
MENKAKPEKANRILYLVVVGVLVVSALVIGLVAAFSKDRTETPNDDSSLQTPAPDDGSNPAPDQGTNADPEDTVTVYLAPATGIISKSHDDSLPVYSVTMDDWRVHQGIDIATAEGADVLATAKGTVKLVWEDPLMGFCVSIDHGNGVVSIYKNLSKTLADGIAQGASVTAGQKLGTVGNTAMIESAESAHLHFEMECNGEQVDPVSYISEESYEASLGADTAYES